MSFLSLHTSLRGNFISDRQPNYISLSTAPDEKAFETKKQLDAPIHASTSTHPSRLAVIFSVPFPICSASSVTLINKWALHHIPLPQVLLAFQSGMCFLLSIVVRMSGSGQFGSFIMLSGEFKRLWVYLVMWTFRVGLNVWCLNVSRRDVDIDRCYRRSMLTPACSSIILRRLARSAPAHHRSPLLLHPSHQAHLEHPHLHRHHLHGCGGQAEHRVGVNVFQCRLPPKSNSSTFGGDGASRIGAASEETTLDGCRVCRTPLAELPCALNAHACASPRLPIGWHDHGTGCEIQMLGPEEACESCQIKPKIDSPGILRARPVWMLCLRAGARAKRIIIADAIGTEAVEAQRRSIHLPRM